jgi:hypothetical protein
MVLGVALVTGTPAAAQRSAPAVPEPFLRMRIHDPAPFLTEPRLRACCEVAASANERDATSRFFGAPVVSVGSRG